MLFFIQIKDDVAVLDHGNIWKIDAGKCIIALSSFLFSAGTRNCFSIEDNGDAAGTVVAGKTKAVTQVDSGIRIFHIDRLLSACNDNGLGGILNQIGECGGRVGHGIRSVTDDKAVVFFVVRLDGLRHGEPVFWLHIGAVYIEYLKAVRLAELLCIRDV